MRLFALSFVLLAACAASTTAAPGRPDTQVASRVVLISVDGLDSRLVTEYRTPFLLDAARRGAWTLRAETPLPAVTVVSHAAMLTGAPPSVNGVAANDYPRDHREQFAWRPLKVQTLMNALAARGKFVSAFVQKPKMNGLLPQEAVNGFYAFSADADELVGSACEELASPPQRGVDAFVFIHLKPLDETGHRYGWLSEEQIAAAREVSEMLRELSSCAAAGDKSLGLKSVLIITSDHGGHGKTHGTAEDALVPWIVHGSGIRSGRRLNTHVRLMDTAPTILHLLGYEPKALLPASDGRVITEILAPRR